MTDGPNFEGHDGRECGEHRTVGSHRAWCYECHEWCYPSEGMACKGCELPALRARVAAALAVCAQVEANPIGWGGAMAVSLARSITAALGTT